MTEGKVKDWMNPSAISTTADETIENISKVMNDYMISSLVVIDHNENPISIVTDTDLVTKVLVNDFKASETLVSEAMSTRKLITIEISDSLDHAADIMVINKIKKLPVINEENKLVGMLSMTDVIRYFSTLDEQETPISKMVGSRPT